MVRNWLKEWVIPASAVLVAATAAWIRFEVAQHELAKDLEELRQAVRRGCDYGPSGFLDPAVHSAHDLHLQHFFEEQLGRRGWRKLLESYQQNGSP